MCIYVHFLKHSSESNDKILSLWKPISDLRFEYLAKKQIVIGTIAMVLRGVRNLLIMASDSVPEGPRLIPGITKNISSACSIGACKIWKFCGRALAVYHGCSLLRKFSSPSEKNQNWRGGDGWCCHLQSENEVEPLPLYMGLVFQETFYSALNCFVMRYETWLSKWHK